MIQPCSFLFFLHQSLLSPDISLPQLTESTNFFQLLAITPSSMKNSSSFFTTQDARPVATNALQDKAVTLRHHLSSKTSGKRSTIYLFRIRRNTIKVEVIHSKRKDLQTKPVPNRKRKDVARSTSSRLARFVLIYVGLSRSA